MAMSGERNSASQQIVDALSGRYRNVMTDSSLEVTESEAPGLEEILKIIPELTKDLDVREVLKNVLTEGSISYSQELVNIIRSLSKMETLNTKILNSDDVSEKRELRSQLVDLASSFYPLLQTRRAIVRQKIQEAESEVQAEKALFLPRSRYTDDVLRQLIVEQTLLSKLLQPFESRSRAFAELERRKNPEKIDGSFHPRNDFEKWMVTTTIGAHEHMPLPSPEMGEAERREALERRYEMLRSIYLSVPLGMMWKSFEETAGTLGYPFIGGATIRGEGIRREDYNIENFYVQMKENLKDPLEIEIANQTIERLERDIEALKKIQEKTHKYVTQGGNNSLEGIAENTPPDGGDFDIKFWRDAMGGLPALSYRDESGKWVQETKTLAEQIFCAFREILRRGERLEEKMGTSEAPERHTGSKLLLKNGERSPKVIPVSVVGTTTQSRSLHPWVYAEKAGALTATRKKNFDEVVEMVSAKSVDDSTRGTWSDMAARFAGLTALSLTEITNESGSQDINRTSGSKLPGSPSGLKLLHRISIGTAAPYIYKDTYNGAFNNTTLPGNIFGIVKGYVMPYFDFYGYDGMTWTQRFRSSPDTVKTFADPTFRWDLFPDNPSAAYGNHIKTMTSVAKFDLEKRSSMDPNSSGTINYRQNEPTKANAEYFDNWTTYIKYAHKYAGQTDAMPFMACQPPSREEKARYADGIPFIDEINPTGQYIRIRVVDENGNDTSGHFESTMKGTFKTSPDYSTRVNQWWYTSPPELTRWMTMADMNKKVIDINTAVVPTQMRRRSDGSVINYPQKTMTIKVRRDAPTVEDVNVAAAKGETARGSLGIYPDLLIKRELIAKGHHIFWYGGSTIADLTRDKLTLHGMFFANDFVTRHRNRVDKGPLESSLTTASVFLERLRKGDPTIDSSFLTMEVPDIQQINVFDGETLLELYYLVGLQIKAEDFTKPTEAIFSNLSGSK